MSLGSRDEVRTTTGRRRSSSWAAQPLEHLVARAPGKLEVEEHEGGKGMLVAVREAPVALQVVDGFLAVARDLEGVGQAGLLEGALEEEYVVGIVLDEQDGL